MSSESKCSSISSSSSSSSYSSPIDVYCRIRPNLSFGDSSATVPPSFTSTLTADTHAVTISQRKDTYVLRFPFTRVFEATSSQGAVYATVVAPVVEDLIRGKNGSILCYGCTGTGKSYTMEGNLKADLADPLSSSRGLLPRAIEEVFHRVCAANQKLQSIVAEDTTSADAIVGYEVCVSFMELYMGRLQDLLKAAPPTLHPQAGMPHYSSNQFVPNRVCIQEDKQNKLILAGLNVIKVKNVSEALHLFRVGASRRIVAATAANPDSSRSHSVFEINVQQHLRSGRVQSSKLRLFDLAGSEQSEQTGSGSAQRLLEAREINQSLLQLSTVIHHLSQKMSYVSFRDSILTRLLQDSLSTAGGHTKLIISTSSLEKDIKKSINSLRLGSVAQQVVLRKVAPMDENEKMYKQLIAIVEDQKIQIQQLQRQLQVNSEEKEPGGSSSESTPPSSPQNSLPPLPCIRCAELEVDLSQCKMKLDQTELLLSESRIKESQLVLLQVEMHSQLEALEAQVESMSKLRESADKTLKQTLEANVAMELQVAHFKRLAEQSKLQLSATTEKHEENLAEMVKMAADRTERERATAEQVQALKEDIVLLTSAREKFEATYNELQSVKEQQLKSELELAEVHHRALRELRVTFDAESLELARLHEAELQSVNVTHSLGRASVQKSFDDMCASNEMLRMQMKEELIQAQIQAAQIEKEKDDAIQLMKQLQNSLSDTIRVHESELRAKDASLKEYQSELARMHQANAQHCAEFEKQSNEIALLNAAVSSAKLAGKTAQRHLMKKLKQIRKSNLSIRQQAESLQMSQCEHEQSHQQLQVQLVSQQDVNQQLLSKLLHSEQQLQLYDERESKSLGLAQTLQSSLDKLNEEYLSLKAEITRLKSCLKEAEEREVKLNTAAVYNRSRIEAQHKKIAEWKATVLNYKNWHDRVTAQTVTWYKKLIADVEKHAKHEYSKQHKAIKILQQQLTALAKIGHASLVPALPPVTPGDQFPHHSPAVAVPAPSTASKQLQSIPQSLALTVPFPAPLLPSASLNAHVSKLFKQAASIKFQLKAMNEKNKSRTFNLTQPASTLELAPMIQSTQSATKSIATVNPHPTDSNIAIVALDTITESMCTTSSVDHSLCKSLLSGDVSVSADAIVSTLSHQYTNLQSTGGSMNEFVQNISQQLSSQHSTIHQLNAQVEHLTGKELVAVEELNRTRSKLFESQGELVEIHTLIDLFLSQISALEQQLNVELNTSESLVVSTSDTLHIDSSYKAPIQFFARLHAYLIQVCAGHNIMCQQLRVAQESNRSLLVQVGKWRSEVQSQRKFHQDVHKLRTELHQFKDDMTHESIETFPSETAVDINSPFQVSKVHNVVTKIMKIVNSQPIVIPQLQQLHTSDSLTKANHKAREGESTRTPRLAAAPPAPRVPTSNLNRRSHIPSLFASSLQSPAALLTKQMQRTAQTRDFRRN